MWLNYTVEISLCFARNLTHYQAGRAWHLAVPVCDGHTQECVCILCLPEFPFELLGELELWTPVLSSSECSETSWLQLYLGVLSAFELFWWQLVFSMTFSEIGFPFMWKNLQISWLEIPITRGHKYVSRVWAGGKKAKTKPNKQRKDPYFYSSHWKAWTSCMFLHGAAGRALCQVVPPGWTSSWGPRMSQCALLCH